MPTLTLEQKVRDAAWHYLSQDVAWVANMRLDELQQLCAGVYHPDAAQLDALARRMGVKP